MDNRPIAVQKLTNGCACVSKNLGLTELSGRDMANSAPHARLLYRDGGSERGLHGEGLAGFDVTASRTTETHISTIF